MNVLWLLLDVANVENLDLMEKLIFVQIVAIELQRLPRHSSKIRKVIDPKWNLFLSPKWWLNPHEVKSKFKKIKKENRG